MIGIRSARLHTDSRTITLHAGAGVVADSDPEEEAAETDVKFSSVLESLVPGGSTHLR
jgi:isochorismate synthase